MNRYKRILNQLIEKSFPELKDKVKIHKISKYVLFWIHGFTYKFGNVHIFIVSYLDDYSDRAVKGLVVHELCHAKQELSQDANFIERFFLELWYGIGWFIGKDFLKGLETKTDKQAIKKGYAHEIYEFKLELNKNLTKGQIKRNKQRGYLTTDEIKSYAKKVGKW